ASLQKDLDDWLYYYNHQRTHQGKMCNGRTPMDTLRDGKSMWMRVFKFLCQRRLDFYNAL
ncbi:MAG TPA: hypothetical protein PK633_13055, partial [Agitococcus sp.]|nr:hypothetical protein [Agitococcus sp.]